MDNEIVRIQRIAITNLKNVEYGEIQISRRRDSLVHGADVLGIYGQNGSGKTTVINALSILKFLLMGLPLPDEYAGYITKGKETAALEFEFNISSGDGTHFVAAYTCTLGVQEGTMLPNMLQQPYQVASKKMAVLNETIIFSGFINGQRYISQTLARTGNEDYLVSPPSKQVILFGKDKKNLQELSGIKSVTLFNSQSFLFALQTLNLVMKHSSNETYKNILQILVKYANQSLFVVDTKNSGLISLDAAIPFVFKIEDQTGMAAGTFLVSLNDRSSLPKQQYDVLRKVIHHMNSVLVQLVPGLTVDIEDHGQQLQEDGKSGQLIQLVSVRGGVRLPLKNESDGIIKIISVLQMLIVLFNSRTITVAIDELDGGIFEYLLGEILKIIASSGEGQLIFTSHNLRPLEMLSDRSIWFTTTDAKQRFTQINVQSTNNLRNVYYRDIVLGSDDISLYDKTNNYEIALAFRLAGAQDGKA